MTKKTTRRLSVLSDANIIIDAHRFNIWKQLCGQCTMYTTKYIQENEARYFRSRNTKNSIDLSEQINQGNIQILTADSDDLNALYKTFTEWFLKSLDPGEIEALALILCEKIDNTLFCTCDGPAIQALAMINKSHLGICCEDLLYKVGMRGIIKKLGGRHKRPFFDKHIKQGSMNYVTSTGLA